MTFPRYLCVLALAVCTLTRSDKVALRLNIGTVIGRIHTVNGTQLEVFESIPFAQPPLGELRFENPFPLNKSDIPINVTQKVTCVNLLNQYASDVEDCLYMKVIIPLDENGNRYSSSLSVLFWLKDENDRDGTSLDVVSKLSLHRVIVVIPNYRVGPLGFLTGLHANLPGNYGLEDQILALNVFLSNSASFNADTSRIFIGGQGTGGVAASILAVSPRTKDLFAGLILFSGSSLTRWGVRSHTSETVSALLINSCNCTSSDVLSMKECLKMVNMSCFADSGPHLRETLYRSEFESIRMKHTTLTPVIDVFRLADSIIPQRIEEIVKKNARLPLFTVFTPLVHKSSSDKEVSQPNLDLLLNSFVHKYEQSMKYIIEALKAKYFWNKNGNETIAQIFIKMINDEMRSFMYDEALMYSKNKQQVFVFEDTDSHAGEDRNLKTDIGNEHLLDALVQFIRTKEVEGIQSFSKKTPVVYDFSKEPNSWNSDLYYFWRRSLPLINSLRIYPNSPIQLMECEKNEQKVSLNYWKTIIGIPVFVIFLLCFLLLSVYLSRRQKRYVVKQSAP